MLNGKLLRRGSKQRVCGSRTLIPRNTDVIDFWKPGLRQR